MLSNYGQQWKTVYFSVKIAIFITISEKKFIFLYFILFYSMNLESAIIRRLLKQVTSKTIVTVTFLIDIQKNHINDIWVTL